MKIKVYNKMFMDAQYSFAMLKFYYGHVTGLLHRSADDFHKYTDELESEYKKTQKEFDKQAWLKHYDVYEGFYPGLFNNSFLISACALFEYHIRKICDLAKKEHKISRDWDEIKESVPERAKRLLWIGGIILKDDPPDSFQHLILTSMPGKKNLSVSELWEALENFFMIRNCLAHHNGVIQKSRNPEKIKNYAIEKGIIVTKADQLELLLTQNFSIEVCDTMEKFFEKLTGAYYSTQLPE